MNMFAWLLAGHLAGDFIFQTGWMAKKTGNYLALIVHGIVYTVAVAVFSNPAGGLSYKALAVIFLSHIFLDQRWFVEFWVRTVNNAGSMGWIHTVVDQSFHLIVLAFVAQYLN